MRRVTDEEHLGRHGGVAAADGPDATALHGHDGIADRSLREVDPTEMATVLFNLIGWGYVHLRSGHGWSPKRAEASVLDPVLNGLRAASPVAAP